MANDLFGGIMKGIGAFMPQDDPNVQLFQMKGEIGNLESTELEIFAKIGKRAYSSICENPEYTDLTEELIYTQRKLSSLREELTAVQNLKSEQDKKDLESIESRTCPNCETLNPDGVKFCQECGARLNLATKVICPECGAEAATGTRFCGECGRQL